MQFKKKVKIVPSILKRVHQQYYHLDNIYNGTLVNALDNAFGNALGNALSNKMHVGYFYQCLYSLCIYKFYKTLHTPITSTIFSCIFDVMA
jgi:hypothetical protein